LTLEGQGKFLEAEQVQREALASWNKMGQSKSPRALTQLGDFARALMAQKKMADAERLLDETLDPATAKLPASAQLLMLRASLRARDGRWHEAAADESNAFNVEPKYIDIYPALASLLVKSGDFVGYEKFCKQLLAVSAGTSDPYMADAVAKSCLFHPATNLDLVKISHLADIAVTRGAGDSGALPFFQNCKALSEYRLGHFAEAADWAGKAIRAPQSYVLQHACAVLAMADWQLGKKVEARILLAKGNELAPSVMPPGIKQQLGNEWLGWLHARVQLEEAAALIQPETVGSTNSASL
jgi:tetratricopeptide (TPR) repeat protein